MKTLLLVTFSLFITFGFTTKGFTNSSCSSIVARTKKSENSPNPKLWLRIKKRLQQKVSHLEHPLTSAGTNPDLIGRAYNRMATELPILRDLLDLSYAIYGGKNLKHSRYISLKRDVANKLISVSKYSRNPLEIFSALEALKLIARIESTVSFPKEKKNEGEKEEKEDKEDTNKAKDDKKEKKKEKEEQEPSWNKLNDEYEPENTDLASDSGGKEKNVDLVLTDVDLSGSVGSLNRPLLRQKKYDEFTLFKRKLSSSPVIRESIVSERTPSKKLIIDSLGDNNIQIPITYGYTLKPGKYNGYEIVESSPGEFKLRVDSKGVRILDLYKIVRENALPSPARQISEQELVNWPEHLLLFTRSLKGLSPLEAAKRLEKYISLEGGFLYYSEGDKINKSQLNEINTRYAKLLSQMPKAQAMANLGVFNCDGAAWIGALLLRDVLGLQVSIAAGKTSAGYKQVDGEKLYAVKSADPDHAWVEVFDGTRWTPFDMTPKNNVPKSESAPTDVKRDRPEESGEIPDSSKKSKDSQENRNDSEFKEENDKSAKDKKSSKEEKDDSQTESNKKEDQDNESDSSTKEGSERNAVAEVSTKRLKDLIDAKSTKREQGEIDSRLIDKVLRQNELMLLESLIENGYRSSFIEEAVKILDSLEEKGNWKSKVETSRRKIENHLYNARFSSFEGLKKQFILDIRQEISSNNAREAVGKLLSVKKLLLEIVDYRKLSNSEREALVIIERILRILEKIKHENSKEYDIVEKLSKALPGNISKAWLREQYGADYDKLGTNANNRLASDIVNGKLKPLLQMAAVREFVDMTLDSSVEPQMKDRPTFNKSLISKPRKDLVITRNPLDFARMLWSLRPGEHMFAPTIQGKQFAISSLETRQVIDLKDPLERKVSVVYYDISASMSGKPIEAQDALLMAYVDKALSEIDAIGRPIHEIYLIPFNDNILKGVHITSINDARSFLSKRMSMRTRAMGSTNIQSVLENFYDIISSSYSKKAQEGRERLFQKANLILFSDGESTINLARLKEKRRSMPRDVEINMNFVSVNNETNKKLKTLSEASRISSNKPHFRQMSFEMIDSVVGISVNYNGNAFATNKKISGRDFTEISRLLESISSLKRGTDKSIDVERILGSIKITDKDIAKLSGLREALSLMKVAEILTVIDIDASTKRRILEAIIFDYQRLVGRSWTEMTYPEKEALESLLEAIP